MRATITSVIIGKRGRSLRRVLRSSVASPRCIRHLPEGTMRRFSIRSLTAFIFVAAIGLAALRNANDLWAGMLLLLALAAVAIAMMGAVILRGGERYGWAGFAFFGGVYLAVAVGPWLSDTFQPQLGTTQVLRHAHDRIMASPTLDGAELADLRERRLELRSQFMQVRVRKESDPTLIA